MNIVQSISFFTDGNDDPSEETASEITTIRISSTSITMTDKEYPKSTASRNTNETTTITNAFNTDELRTSSSIITEITTMLTKTTIIITNSTEKKTDTTPQVSLNHSSTKSIEVSSEKNTKINSKSSTSMSTSSSSLKTNPMHTSERPQTTILTFTETKERTEEPDFTSFDSFSSTSETLSSTHVNNNTDKGKNSFHYYLSLWLCIRVLIFSF